jgi:hypothetical protein
MSSDERDLRQEARREAAPASAAACVLLIVLALVSYLEDWTLVGGVGWWAWLVLALPALVLTADLTAGATAGVVRTRAQAIVLTRVLAAANIAALAILVAGLVSTSTRDLGGGELLLTGAVLWLVNVIVFGIWFWELDAGGPVARAHQARPAPDFQFPQDENPQLAEPGWRPAVWDYLYLALTNAIAFSPTDAMPLSRNAKALMAIESVASVVAIVLVGARAVNVLGS